MLRRAFSWLFLFGAVGLGLATAVHGHFSPAYIGTHFLLPFYAVCTAMQYLWPEQPNTFERGEVLTDVLHNLSLVGISSGQNFLVHAWLAGSGAALLFQHGWLPEAWSARHLPLWTQVVVAFLTFDLLFYITHRLAHEVDWLWRLHSVHHCAHRLSVLNASRAHPLDLLWRRLVPIFVTLQTGVSPEAFIVSGTVGSVLATLTHMNVDFRFGPLNYLIGTNEVHRWHHSTRLEEARNFSIVLLWDHLLGTFVYPAGRARPERLGLFDERLYPLHAWWPQMQLPWRWKALKNRQAALDLQAPQNPGGQQKAARPKALAA